jgi:hypothetical protein
MFLTGLEKMQLTEKEGTINTQNMKDCYICLRSWWLRFTGQICMEF